MEEFIEDPTRLGTHNLLFFLLTFLNLHYYYFFFLSNFLVYFWIVFHFKCVFIKTSITYSHIIILDDEIILVPFPTSLACIQDYSLIQFSYLITRKWSRIVSSLQALITKLLIQFSLHPFYPIPFFFFFFFFSSF